MSDREKLIEILDRLFVDYGAQAIYFTDQECEDIADYLISNGVTVQKWIPVSERLPDESGEVIGYDAIHGIRVMFYHYSLIYTDWKRVTHWMPLPEPPKEDDDET